VTKDVMLVYSKFHCRTLASTGDWSAWNTLASWQCLSTIHNECRVLSWPPWLAYWRVANGIRN